MLSDPDPTLAIDFEGDPLEAICDQVVVGGVVDFVGDEDNLVRGGDVVVPPPAPSLKLLSDLPEFDFDFVAPRRPGKAS